MDLTTDSKMGRGGHRFIFPSLRNSEILECLRELGIEMTKTELLEPANNREKLRNVFLKLLEMCTGKSEEDFLPSSVIVEKAQTMEFPELHNDKTFYDWNFYEAMKHLFIVCAYDDFSWRDLHAPNPKRVKDQLSAILNLAKYRESQISNYLELSETRAKVLHNVEMVKQEQQTLKELHETTFRETESKFREKEQAHQECMELELEITAQNKRQAAAREEAELLKKKANNLKDELDTATWALQEAEVEEESLRHQVVSSPDRRKLELERKNENLENEKAECEKMDTHLQQTKTKIVNVQAVSKSVEAVTTNLEELHVLATKYNQAVDQLEGTTKEIKQNEQKTAETAVETEQVERTLNRMEEKIVHQRKHNQMQIEAAQEALDTAKSRLLNVEKDRRHAMARVDKYEEEVREMEAAMEKERAKTEKEIEGMVQEYREVERAFLERNETRMQLITGGN